MAQPKPVQLYAILPVLVTATAFILSFLCIFAGNTPGMMESYSVFTLNTTRLGQNAVEKIDNTIMGFNVTKIITKRDLPADAVVYAATITAAPTLVRRDLDDFVSGLTAGAGSIKSNVGDAVDSVGDAVDSVQTAIESKVTAVASAVESKASSIEGVVASKISSAIGSAQTAVVDAVNGTYNDWIDTMDLKGFYSIHMRTTCEGNYITPSGQNITIGGSAIPPNGTEMVVDSCSSHSALNPLGLIRILFEIGIIFTGFSLLLAIWGTIRFSKRKAMLIVACSLAALSFLGLATILTHGLSIAVSKLLNLLGSGIGLNTTYGGKFIALSWATVILMLVNIALWVVLYLWGEQPVLRHGIVGKTSVVDNEKTPSTRPAYNEKPQGFWPRARRGSGTSNFSVSDGLADRRGAEPVRYI